MKFKLSKITISWALYIIISASFMRQVLNFLIEHLGRTELTMLLWGLFLLAGAVTLFFLYKAHPTISRICLFLGVTALVVLYASQIKAAEERIHLINFGLLGWLALKDMKKTGKGFREAGFALLFCLIIAAIDEIFQHYLPYRIGQISDILLAGIGGLWGISLFLIIKIPKKSVTF